MPLQTVEELNRKATNEIVNIVEKRPEGYDEAEVISSKELLDRNRQGKSL